MVKLKIKKKKCCFQFLNLSFLLFELEIIINSQILKKLYFHYTYCLNLINKKVAFCMIVFVYNLNAFHFCKHSFKSDKNRFSCF